jgi:hypothetical protein
MPKITLEDGGFAVHTYNPGDFNPHTASDEQLLISGVPSRPKDQELLKLWNKALSNHKNYIIPEFEVSKIKRKAAIINLVDGVSDIWSGSVAKHSSGENFSWIEGKWIVPNCHPSDGKNSCSMVQWIGLGGVGSALFQAGTETVISFDSHGVETKSTTAWFEWWSDISITRITNFTVSVGDVVWFMLCASGQSNLDGTVFVQNVSTGDSTSFTVQSLEAGLIKSPLVADTAEWVVERPSTDGVPNILANYTLAYFDEGKAQSVSGSPGNWTNKSSHLIDFADGVSVNMTSDGTTKGTLLSAVDLKTADALETEWFAAK